MWLDLTPKNVSVLTSVNKIVSLRFAVADDVSGLLWAKVTAPMRSVFDTG